MRQLPCLEIHPIKDINQIVDLTHSTKLTIWADLKIGWIDAGDAW